jgi:mono/diheme cytochrome c family protein
MASPRVPDQPSAKQKRARILLGVIGALLVAALGAFILSDAGGNWNVPPEARTLVNPEPASSTSVAAGKAIYEDHCADCHGHAGDGKGSKAPRFRVKPADFTDAAVMDTRTDGELYWKITVGRKPMPSFETKLTDDERWMVVDYIRTFAHPK